MRFPMKPFTGFLDQFRLLSEAYENIYNSMQYDYASDENAKMMEE